MCLSGCSKPQDPKAVRRLAIPLLRRPPRRVRSRKPQDHDCGGPQGPWLRWNQLEGRLYSRQAPTEDGWLVQEITYNVNAQDASGATVKNTSVHYWEAWPVTKGATQPDATDQAVTAGGSVFNDQFSGPPLPNTKGTRSLTGTIMFHPGTLPADFVRNNPNAYAGILHATTSKPDFWNGSGEAHSLSSTWDCTKTPGTSTVTGQAGTTPVTGTK